MQNSDTLSLDVNNSVSFRSERKEKIWACSEKPDLSNNTKNSEIESQEKKITFFSGDILVLLDSWTAC